ncbi:MAG TPA: hypothetical protein VFE61_32770 [Candidatus Sulfotelmatobacter sp.]|nr:hypothetical protein [Candidatus Sulfotelmatobacter sp.]
MGGSLLLCAAASSGNWSEILNSESDTFTCGADGPNAVTVVVTGI